MSGVVLSMGGGGGGGGEDDIEEDVANLLQGDDYDGDGYDERYDGPRAPRRSRGYGVGGGRRGLVKSGTVGRLLSTLVLACIFFGIGFTKSLLDQSAAHNGDQQQQPTQKQMASSTGYVTGFILCAFLLAKLSRFFLLLIATLSLGTALAVVPWASSVAAVDAVYTAIGAALAVLTAGGSVVCLDFWGNRRRSAPCLLALHFCLSLGLLAGPAIVDPLSHARVPYLVQSRLKMPLPPAATSETSTAAEDIRRLKREIADSNGPTMDPNLLEIFGPPPDELVVGKQDDPGEDDDIREIFRQLEPVETVETESMMEDEELMELLSSRKKRSAGMGRGRAMPLPNQRRGGFDLEPPVYGRTRLDMGLPLPPVARYPSRPQQQQPMDYNAWAGPGGDYGVGGGGGMPLDYPIGGFDDEVPMTPPPKKVVEAVKTLENFMAGKDVIDADELTVDDDKETTLQSSTGQTTTWTTTTTTATTTTTTATTTSTTTTTETTTTSSELRTTTTTFTRHKKKPAGPLDNDTGLSKDGNKDDKDSKDVTILNVLNEYGVSSHENVGFVIDSVYSFVLSIVLCFCLCYNPREPRSTSSSAEHKSSEESRIFKCSFTFLLFFLTFVHWSMFVSYQYTLPKIQPLLAQVGGGLATSASSADPRLLFVGVFTAARFLAAIGQAGCCGNAAAAACLISLAVTFLSSVLLVFAEQVNPATVWVAIAMQAVGLAPLLPSIISWGDSYIPMTNGHAISVVLSGLALAELAVPQMFAAATLAAPHAGPAADPAAAASAALEASDSSKMGFALSGASTIALLLFLSAFAMGRKHGSRFTRPQSSGYELASQNDLTAADDDGDDEDDFEVTSSVSVPTLRLNSVEEEDEDDGGVEPAGTVQA